MLSRFRTVLAALWLGLVVTLAAVAAPVLFAGLERTDAGRLAGNMFRIEAYAALGLAVALFLIERRLATLRMQAGQGSVLSVNLLLVLGALFCTVSGYFALQPMMEAARAGQEGAGFKVVAAEVRNLSAQTEEAASQITRGIMAAAEQIDREMAAAESMRADDTTRQLDEIARQIEVMSRTLSDTVPYLSELSGTMDSGIQHMTRDVIDTLGDMQFQDINRQMLEQVNSALGSLSGHFAQLYQLIDGQAPPPPVQLEELVTRWTESYVMQSQWSSHQQTQPTGKPVAPTDNSTVGPAIELF